MFIVQLWLFSPLFIIIFLDKYFDRLSYFHKKSSYVEETCTAVTLVSSFRHRNIQLLNLLTVVKLLFF